MKTLLFTLPTFCLCLLLAATTNAQNPYAPLGVETEVLTLTEGKYPEFIPNKELVAIGGVMLNTKTGEVVEFLEPDTVVYSLDPTVSTRFLSVDPIARAFPELTPYQFAGNKPIIAIDLDGLEEWVVTKKYTSFDDQDPALEYTFDENADPLEGAVHVVHKYPFSERSTTSSDISIPMNAVERSSNPDFTTKSYSIRDDNAYALQVARDANGRRQDLLDEFLFQEGPTNSLFLQDHAMTEGVRKMGEVDRLRFLIYDKYNGNIPTDGSYTNFDGDFGLKGLLETGTNLPGQFVGSLSGDVFVDEAGENLIFVISDSKSRKSLLYRLGDEPEREDAFWGGNTYQKYFWIEPINKNYNLGKERNRRDEHGNIQGEPTPGEKVGRPFEG